MVYVGLVLMMLASARQRVYLIHTSFEKKVYRELVRVAIEFIIWQRIHKIFKLKKN